MKRVWTAMSPKERYRYTVTNGKPLECSESKKGLPM